MKETKGLSSGSKEEWKMAASELDLFAEMGNTGLKEKRIETIDL